MSLQPHYFLAVPISHETRTAIHQTINNERERLHFQSWVHPEDFHITLFFLGAATQAQLNGIIKSLSTSLSHFKPFILELDRFDTFGSKEQPRVFWTGIRPSTALNQLQRKVVDTCSQFEFIPEDRPYRPHITLARRWKGNDSFSLPHLRLAEEASSFEVNEVILYQSHPHRTPKYEPVDRVSFAQ